MDMDAVSLSYSTHIVEQDVYIRQDGLLIPAEGTIIIDAYPLILTTVNSQKVKAKIKVCY